MVHRSRTLVSVPRTASNGFSCVGGALMCSPTKKEGNAVTVGMHSVIRIFH